ncbi:MAG: hypothetical protein J0L52_00795 [Caulobacterales bacterium]|nr:hypothetical protein [Caulobacterales bacterium]
MKPLVPILICAALLGLGGCVNLSRSEALAPIAGAAGYRVAGVNLTLDPEIETTPEFAGIFQARVQAELDGCAQGQRPLHLEASISRLDRANPVQVAVIGGANVLRGRARLIDPATGHVVGNYEIGRTVIGARIAVFEMAESEEQLSTAFGQELCDLAFSTTD